ncbi:unnamed protein product, partial [Mesorhabditis belari]|uniref:ubiquitinyl hydrolase 1 n=1 Tax=Mesorhabditis belari TaxID=2138241 RepID=A0AAF3FND9_9BILA
MRFWLRKTELLCRLLKKLMVYAALLFVGKLANNQKTKTFNQKAGKLKEKIDIQVEIPVRGFELNDKLANTLHEHVQDDLIAMSHHSGGLGGGHYTASAINPNGKWYEFNDSCVSERNPPDDRLKASSPYMLVYRRRNHCFDDGKLI